MQFRIKICFYKDEYSLDPAVEASLHFTTDAGQSLENLQELIHFVVIKQLETTENDGTLS